MSSALALAAEPPRRGAVLVAGAPTASREAEALARAVRAALAEHPDVRLLPAAEEAFLFRSPRPRTGRKKSALPQAKKHLDAAARALAEFELAGAAKAVVKAKQTLAPWSGLRSAVDLERERLELSVAIAYATRDEQSLGRDLQVYAARFPGLEPPQGMWPPGVLDRLRELASERPTVLTVRSQPSSQVFVDGREVGSTPIRLGALPRGEHRVELIAPGHYPTDVTVETSGAKEGLLDVVLVPSFGRRLAKVRPELPLEPALLAELQALGLDFVVLAGAQGSRQVLRRVDLTAAPRAAVNELASAELGEPGARVAIARLFPGPAPDGVSASAERGAVPAWAWIGGGAGAAAVGAGIVLRLLAVSTYQDYGERQGALTQTEAYELRDRSSAQATGGAVLLGVGLAAIAGVAGAVLFDLAGGAP